MCRIDWEWRCSNKNQKQFKGNSSLGSLWLSVSIASLIVQSEVMSQLSPFSFLCSSILLSSLISLVCLWYLFQVPNPPTLPLPYPPTLPQPNATSTKTLPATNHSNLVSCVYSRWPNFDPASFQAGLRNCEAPVTWRGRGHILHYFPTKVGKATITSKALLIWWGLIPYI